MSEQKLDILLEAALFYKGGSATVSELAKAIDASPEAITEALKTLEASLSPRGIRLVREGNTVALGTAPEASALVEKMRKEELEGPLGKAGLETLAVIIFRGPLAKSDIDYVRGVNCGYILRSLMIRGLIERTEKPDDKRSFLYQATAELPAYLGVPNLEAMPDYAETRTQIEKVFAEREKITAAEAATDVASESHE